MLYFLIISISMLVIEAISILVATLTKSMTITYAIIAPFAVNGFTLVVLGVVSITMRYLLPRKLWHYEKQIFVVKEREKKIYDVIKIKKWKDRVPEMGWTAGFSKKKINSLEKNYLYTFLQETCFAESMHWVAGIIPFVLLLFLHPLNYFFTIPILFINLILHILPCIIQRYNRYRLVKIYERNLV